ncbi:HSF-type DNA-binding-domain-containing protein, partial [Tribonema minus]
SVSAFLSKTFDIFSNPQFQAEGICGWSAKGDAVIIHNLRDFSDRVLPQYFKHGNFQSFVRQLNMYNFKKTVADPTNGEFKHPLFRRGMRHVLHLIKRK